ncbi:MAG: hypothetical protein SNJ79_04295, partial [Sphingomonadaceae bacterium]
SLAGDLGVRLDGGLLFGRWGELRVGLSHAEVKLDQAVLPIDPDLLKFEDTTWRIAFSIDALDELEYPTTGAFAQVLLEDHVSWLGGDLSYTRMFARGYAPLTRGRTTLVLGAEAGATLAGDSFLLGDFRMGGFLRLSGLAPAELIGRHSLLGRAVVYHRLFDKSPIIDFPLYVGGSLEAGNAFEDWSAIGLRPAGSLFLSADTPLGPLTLGGGATGEGQSLYLILGRIF